ncbi:MAG: MATE family efflux transporter [Methanobacteriaceae archaeon]|jgi:putative MATE family efflux protein|nr:MATE family efflux transporter [Methanobacteriaceae archaeon]
MINMEKTKEVETLLGDPKKAVLALAGPTIIAMVINSLYALIDAFWVAGLGDTFLAAIGFVNPLYYIILGFSNGLGAGATSVISRYIGARNKKEADNAAIHVLILIVVFSIFFTILLSLFLRPFLLYMEAGSAITQSMEYGSILFAGSVFIVFSSTAYGIFRAEGNAKKTTYAMLFGSILNMILDPIFIYTLNLGLKGAAIATVLSLACVSFLLLYWFFKDTYIDFNLKDFIYKNKIIAQILNIGLPTGLEFLLVGVLSASINIILMIVSGVDSVAVYSGGWRVVSLVMIPSVAIGTAVVAVVGANFGAREYENIKLAHNYAIKFALIIAVILSLLVFIFAPYISALFTYSPVSANINESMTTFLRITSLFYLFLPFGVPSTFLFRGVGKGLNALLITFMRSLMFQVLFSYILAIPLGFGENGVWYGIVIGSAIGNMLSYVWAKLYLRSLIETS